MRSTTRTASRSVRAAAGLVMTRARVTSVFPFPEEVEAQLILVGRAERVHRHVGLAGPHRLDADLGAEPGVEALFDAGAEALVAQLAQVGAEPCVEGEECPLADPPPGRERGEPGVRVDE